MARIQYLAAVCIVFAIVGFAGAGKGNIPSYINVCKRNDPKLDECIMKSIDNLRPKLIEGIPELNVPPIEPLSISEIVVSPGGRFRAVGRNIKVYGPGRFMVTSLRASVDDLVFKGSVFIPELYFEADYDVDTKILVVPVKGTGRLVANSTKNIGDFVMRGRLISHESDNYLYFHTIDITMDMEDGHIHLDNLFGGDAALSEATNRALNEGSWELLQATRPIAEKVVSQYFLDIANKITKRFTFEELFPAD